MEAECPSCRTLVVVEETSHYSRVVCPACGAAFEALSQETRQVGQDYLDRLLAGEPEKPPEGGS
jgi:predicted RNA-binding Zn-ribbon protein involved in translation (DUF1610 family)